MEKDRSFWHGIRGLIYCRSLKSRNSFCILATLIILVKVECDFSHFSTWIICEPVIISIMRCAGLIPPLVSVVIDFTRIASIAAEATGVAPIPTKGVTCLHISVCIKPSAEHLHQTLNSWAKYGISLSPWASIQVTESRFWYWMVDWAIKECIYSPNTTGTSAKISKMVRIHEHSHQC